MRPATTMTPIALVNAAAGTKQTADPVAAAREALAAAGVEAVVLRANGHDRTAMGPDPMSRDTAPVAVLAGRRRGRELAARLAACVA